MVVEKPFEGIIWDQLSVDEAREYHQKFQDEIRGNSAGFQKAPGDYLEILQILQDILDEAR